MHCDSSCLPSLVCPVLLCCCGLRGLRGEIADLQHWRSTLKRLSPTGVDLTSRTRHRIAPTILRQHPKDCHSSKACKHAHHHTLQSEESTLRARTEKSRPCFNITCRRVAKRPSPHSLECKFYVHRSIYLVLCSSTYQVLCMLGTPALRGSNACASSTHDRVAGRDYCRSFLLQINLTANQRSGRDGR
jgi:hypothetical protein